MRLSLVQWLIAAAVLANGIVFYWQHQQTAAPSTAGIEPLGQLKLLGELEQRPQAAESRAADPVPPRAELPVAEQEPSAVEDTPLSSGAASAAGMASLTGNELGDSEPALIVDAPVEPPEAAVEEPAVQRCWSAGPIADDALSEQLTAVFAAAGVSMDLVLKTTEVAPDHWVYLPTSGEQADVRRLSRELRQGGMDNFQITDGPLAGSLSMGLFRDGDRAVAVRDTLRQRGHQAYIYERPAFREQPWIAIDENARTALDWPAVEGVLPGYENLRLLATECPEDG
jgi:hypothetical protein